MFEKLFCSKAVLRRHLEGPLSVERAAYLEELAAQGMARGTLLHRASYCLCVAVELQQWSPDHCFDEEEVRSLAAAWAAKRVAAGRASGTKWPEVQFRFAATDFLRSLSASARDLPRPRQRLRHPGLPDHDSRAARRGIGALRALHRRRQGEARPWLTTTCSALSFAVSSLRRWWRTAISPAIPSAAIATPSACSSASSPSGTPRTLHV